VPAGWSADRSRSRCLDSRLAAAIAALCLLAPGSALAQRRQVSIVEEDTVTDSPTQVLQELRHLGATELRLVVHWTDLAPDPGSARRPGFHATDPAAYPVGSWAPVDSVLRQARADGVRVMLTITGHAPRWAFGPGEPGGSIRNALGAWRPNPGEFGQLVQAIATRYSGHYHGLPRVSTWQIYSEPNFGEGLAPQSVGPVYTSAVMYRALVAAAWRALHASGHGHDTIIIGARAARGQQRPRVVGETPPLDFVRELYCLDRRYRPFRGRAARQHGCPSSAAAFRRQNPGLFRASGFAVHPYPLGADMRVPPDRTRTPNPDYAAFAQLPHFTQGLDRALRSDGSRRHYPIWNTEYGYISDPPNHAGASLADQAYFLNWAEYLSYKNPRLASFMQFLLLDPNPSVGVAEFGGFASGLIFYPTFMAGAAKPALDAWRLPLYLPSTRARRGHRLEVWGCVRPGPYAFRDTHTTQLGQVQFKPSGSSSWRTVSRVRANGSCYFDLRLQFPSSGQVRLTYTYPLNDLKLRPTYGNAYFDPLAPLSSRIVSIGIR
jgi:hypothetical protein